METQPGCGGPVQSLRRLRPSQLQRGRDEGDEDDGGDERKSCFLTCCRGNSLVKIMEEHAFTSHDYRTLVIILTAVAPGVLNRMRPERRYRFTGTTCHSHTWLDMLVCFSFHRRGPSKSVLSAQSDCPEVIRCLLARKS